MRVGDEFLYWQGAANVGDPVEVVGIQREIPVLGHAGATGPPKAAVIYIQGTPAQGDPLVVAAVDRGHVVLGVA